MPSLGQAAGACSLPMAPGLRRPRAGCTPALLRRLGPMAFSGMRNLAKIGNGLSSSVGGTLGRVGNVLGLPIGIEFGTGSLKILQVAAGDPPVLVAAACLETPDELMTDHRKRLEFQIQGLPRLIKHGGFKGRR